MRLKYDDIYSDKKFSESEQNFSRVETPTTLTSGPQNTWTKHLESAYESLINMSKRPRNDV